MWDPKLLRDTCQGNSSDGKINLSTKIFSFIVHFLRILLVRFSIISIFSKTFDGFKAFTKVIVSITII